MGTILELNALLVLPKQFEDKMEVGKRYSVIKNGSRIMPIGTPMEFCDSNYKYIGKLKVLELSIRENETTIHFEVLRLFSNEESATFTNNFIKK